MARLITILHDGIKIKETVHHPVSSRVNSPQNDNPACVEPVQDGYKKH
jgi:hypothetical protein